MKTKFALVFFFFAFIASCGKEKGMPGATTYPTVKEEALKGVARTRFDSPNPTAAQLDRRAKNTKLIADMGLPVLESLPVVEDDHVVKFRTPSEVAKRCLATTFCAVKGETNDQELVNSLIKDYAASSYLSPEEQKFVGNLKPSKQNLLDYSWRYECVHVFLWALNARDGLAASNEICPVSADMKLLKKAGPTDFVPKATLRPSREILDMADLYYRLHWSAIELRIKGNKSDKLDEEIIRERHRALNWLIRYLNQEWDDVSTDT